MSFQSYSRLTPHQGIVEVPLSRFSSGSSGPKLNNFPPPPTSNHVQPQSRRRPIGETLAGWWMELAGLALAFGIMLCTVILLAYYDGKPLDETPQSPSLNTLVNIFSAIEAGLIVYIAAEILAQTKWHRFHSEAALADFKIIDDASRGARGSAQVLVNPRLGSMATIGALITLLSMLIGPMLQETVSFGTKSVPESATNSTAPVARFYAPPQNPEVLGLDVGLKGTMINGLSPANTSSTTPSFGCSSGNCTFETPYTSLAVCASCQQLDITKACNGLQPIGNCNYTLPNGHTLWQVSEGEGDFTVINISSAFNLSTEMAIPENDLQRQLALGRFSVITLTNGPLCTTNGSNPDCILSVPRDNATLAKLTDGGVVGAYCDLALCANTYVADIKESVLSETIISSTDSRNLTAAQYYVSGDNHFDPAIVPEDCYINGSRFTRDQFQDTHNSSWTYVQLLQADSNSNFLTPNTTMVPIDCVFAMRDIVYVSLQQFTTPNPFYLDGSGEAESATGMAGGVFDFDPSAANIPTQLLNLNFGVQPLFNHGNASFQTISSSFQKLATAMTTYIRQNSAQPPGVTFSGLEGQLADIPPSAPGVLFRSQTIIIVRWYWIILPSIVFIAMGAYLTAAMVRSGVPDRNGQSHARLWKSNSLVPLVVGYNSQFIDAAQALSNRDALQALQRRRVTLIEGKEGWAFVDMGYRDRS